MQLELHQVPVLVVLECGGVRLDAGHLNAGFSQQTWQPLGAPLLNFSA
jgi:hypothetical protein